MNAHLISKSLTLVLLAVIVPFAGQAKDLGTIGATYLIVERDALEEIEERAKQVDWGKLFDKEENEQRIRNYRPKDLVSLPRVSRERVRLVDMSHTLDFDIPDGQGGVLYPAGYTFNPLDYIAYTKTIVVINGADREQVEWFKESLYNRNAAAVLWIIDGNYYDLSVELGRAVYYATSLVAERFGLKAVPSVIVQKGDLLEVTEVDVRQKNRKS